MAIAESILYGLPETNLNLLRQGKVESVYEPAPAGLLGESKEKLTAPVEVEGMTAIVVTQSIN